MSDPLCNCRIYCQFIRILMKLFCQLTFRKRLSRSSGSVWVSINRFKAGICLQSSSYARNKRLSLVLRPQSKIFSRIRHTYSSVNSSISPASSRSALRSLSAMRSRGEWNMSIIRRRPRPIDIWDVVNLQSQLSVYCLLSETFIHSHFGPWLCYCSLPFDGLILSLPSSRTFWFRGAGFVVQRHVSVAYVGLHITRL